MAIVNDKHNNIKVGDFVYGCYIESGCDAPCIIFGDGEQIEVDKKTLGQLTGLKDKCGVEIYEGDTLKVTEDGGAAPNHVVEFNNVCAGYIIDTPGCDFDMTTLTWAQDSCYFEYEIIGNIHQNPELADE